MRFGAFLFAMAAVGALAQDGIPNFEDKWDEPIPADAPISAKDAEVDVAQTLDLRTKGKLGGVAAANSVKTPQWVRVVGGVV
jgi:hypothetical protein